MKNPKLNGFAAWKRYIDIMDQLEHHFKVVEGSISHEDRIDAGKSAIGSGNDSNEFVHLTEYAVVTDDDKLSSAPADPPTAPKVKVPDGTSSNKKKSKKKSKSQQNSQH